MSGGGATPLTCDGWCDEKGTVAMIDNKGYAYCEPCGLRRRGPIPCRKLRPHELARLLDGKQLAHY